MTCHQDDESDEYIEDGRLGFFQLLLVARRYEHEPPRIDHEEDTDEHEEAVHVRNNLTDETVPVMFWLAISQLPTLMRSVFLQFGVP